MNEFKFIQVVVWDCVQIIPLKIFIWLISNGWIMCHIMYRYVGLHDLALGWTLPASQAGARRWWFAAYLTLPSIGMNNKNNNNDYKFFSTRPWWTFYYFNDAWAFWENANYKMWGSYIKYFCFKQTKWIERMMDDPAVQATYLSPEEHAKFYGSFEGNMLVKKSAL